MNRNKEDGTIIGAADVGVQIEPKLQTRENESTQKKEVHTFDIREK